jgi:hypothetical protein
MRFRDFIMKLRIFIALIYFYMLSPCHAFECNTDASELNDRVLIPSNQSGREVITSTRSYFYTAPKSTCANKQLFLIKGDVVDAYFDYGDYTYVMYINLKTGEDTTGWLLTHHLKETGFGMGPKQ